MTRSVEHNGAASFRYSLAFKLWSAKQVKSKAAFRLWYAKQVLGGERELRLVHALCHPARLTLDVGSNRGLYAVAALSHSSGVLAFEPQPYYAEFLRKFMPRRIDVRECAISDHRGTATLLVPSDPRMHAEAHLSAADGNETRHGAFVELSVATLSIDQVVTEPVGLIKIDVEGHELAVLNGASNVIQNWRPNVIIEIENRHAVGAVERAFAWFAARRYRGYFLRGDVLVPADGTESEPKKYVYNYIFLPFERELTVQPSLFAALRGVFTV
jgi:FkbM family methyltransferase